MALKITLLRWAETLIEQNFHSTQLSRQQFNLIGFTRTNKQGGVRRSSFAGDPRYGTQASGLSQ